MDQLIREMPLWQLVFLKWLRASALEILFAARLQFTCVCLRDGFHMNCCFAEHHLRTEDLGLCRPPYQKYLFLLRMCKHVS